MNKKSERKAIRAAKKAQREAKEGKKLMSYFVGILLLMILMCIAIYSIVL
jgi:heme/copper-type cytochrome/quinol oxidase subunit 4